MENEQVILSETPSPLGGGATDTPTPPPSTPAPPLSEDDEPYVILRSEISLSSVRCPSPATLAPDYFSLDLNDAKETKGTPPFTPLPPSPPQPQEAAITEPERTLEGNWFRANCRFKSAMLQLHREIIDFCDFLSPTPEEQTSRNAAIESVSGYMYMQTSNIFSCIFFLFCRDQKLLRSVKLSVVLQVEVFGSFKMGLYLPSSDVDVNLKSLPNWEEKQKCKQYYYLDAYYRHKMEKEIKRGFKKVPDTEHSVFNNEEQRRLELLWGRERQKEEQVEPLKREMQSRMAQVMKEQARLKEEMAYQYTLGNYYILPSIRNF